MAPRSPPTALSQALIAFTIQFDNEFEHRIEHLADPASALSQDPMVLHRSGYPDGS